MNRFILKNKTNGKYYRKAGPADLFVDSPNEATVYMNPATIGILRKEIFIDNCGNEIDYKTFVHNYKKYNDIVIANKDWEIVPIEIRIKT